MAEHHFRNGADRQTVAQKLNLPLEKLYKILGGKKKADVAEALKSLTDYTVEEALLKKALGYYYDEIKESEKEKGDETITTHKEAPPDVAAIKFWLECKCPEYWGSKTEKSSSEEKLDNLLSHLNENMDDKS